jgi:hypothetical protein
MNASRFDPLTKRHRRMFAVVRVTQISLAVVGGTTALLALTPPPSPGHLTREMHFVAWSTPGVFIAAAGVCVAAAVLLQVVAIPLKRRWAEHLRGWIK